MTVQLRNEYAHFIGTSRSILAAADIKVVTGTDFTQYAEIIEKERPKQALGAPFDPAKVDLSSKNSFWMIARDGEGSLLHTQAFRIIPANGVSLAQYMRNAFRHFPPALPDIDFERSRFRASPGSHFINGKIVYHGEVWMTPEMAGYRGSGLTTVLARTGLLEVYHRWDPDWMFGIMAQVVAFKGFAERMGYMHNEPRALLWFRDGQDKPLEGFLSYLSREDLQYLLDVPVTDLVAQAG